MTYLPTIIGVTLFIVFTPMLLVVGLLLIEALKSGAEWLWSLARRGVLWFFASMPAEIDLEAVQAHLDRLRAEALPTEEPGTYHEPSGPAMHRLKDMKFRFMPCGHATYEWSDLKQACLQCVLEGRVATKDRGKQK